jgi:acyl-CoA thioesterase FadM
VILRFLIAILGALGEPRVGVLDGITTSHRCWPVDCDANLHMNDGRYLSISGLARVALMIRIGLGEPFRRRGWRPVAGAADVRYFKEIRPFERFAIRTRIVAWDEKYFVFEHMFDLARREGAVAASRVLVRGLFRGPAGPVPTAAVLAALGFAGAAPEPGPEVAHFMEMAEVVRRQRDARASATRLS